MLTRLSPRHYRLLRLSSRFQSTAAAAVEEPPSETTTTAATAATPFPHLFQPLDLGPDLGVLPNRAMMGSMHTGLEGLSMPRWLHRLMTSGNNKSGADNSSDAHSLDRLAAYFAERAAGGVGLMVTGGIAPNRAGWTGPFSSQLLSDKEVGPHRVVTDAVHAIQVPVGYSQDETVPARICLQILHTGRYAYHPFAVSASNHQSPISPFRPRALSTSEVQQTCSDFIHTAVLAKQAGYDGVEVMGSEGYLLSQFLSPRTNQGRTDPYGGASLANRARLPLEIVQGMRQAVGPDFLIIFRLSLLDLVEQGLLFEESLELAWQLQEAGTSILNTGIGWHESRVPTIATSVPRASFGFPTAQLVQAGVVTIPVVATNRFNHPQTAETVLQQNGADLISMARPFLADPDLMRKSRMNLVNEINTCIGCNQACLDHVFTGKIASCLVNPRACHETTLVHPDQALLPVEQRQDLHVVGAGPAGAAFCIAAAQRGHNVTLYESGAAVGGQFHMAKRIPGKEEFHETLRYLQTQLTKLGVNVKLNTTVSTQTMMDTPGKWILATGVHPRNPKIPGQDHPSVLSYLDVLKHNKPVGDRVALIGAGGIGFDVAEFLLHKKQQDNKHDPRADEVDPNAFYKEWGIDTSLQTRGGLTEAHPVPADRSIFLLQRKEGKVGAGLGKTTGWIHRATLKQSGGVQFLEGVTYDRIDEEGNLHITRKGQKQVLEVDNIVICAGQVENRDLLSLNDNDDTGNDAHTKLLERVYTIGGAQEAGELDAKRAMDMGTRLAQKIHEQDVVPGKHVFSAEQGVEERFFKLMKRFM